MKANFKPLGIAAAVAAVTAGYAGVVNAQTVAADTETGDLAIVPYYTVLNGYSTGINIINTADQTHAIKVRFRRAEDSMDALDFNVVLSPYDMYTGFISASGDDITFTSNDNSCTAPAMTDGKFTMPSIYRAGAETGYIEIISMGAPDPATANAIDASAKHGSDGVPADCGAVRDNFFADSDGTVKGVLNPNTSYQGAGATLAENQWIAADDALKVSYFIKSDETGVEFGDNAVHVAGFMTDASMTNQQKGVFEGDLQGFDHPDLNGGSPLGMASVNQFAALRNVMGASALINDWSANSNDSIGFTVDTDWVVTYPGQYTMLNLPFYLGNLALGDEDFPCTSPAPSGGIEAVGCDFRDIPMTAVFNVYDREEQGITVEDSELVVSPQPPGVTIIDTLDKEVNVIEWGSSPVLGAPEVIRVATPDGANFGWASLTATSSTAKTQAICNYAILGGAAVPVGEGLLPKLPLMTCNSVAGGTAPVAGFVAWQRAFAANPGSNYGRIVEHSRVLS